MQVERKLLDVTQREWSQKICRGATPVEQGDQVLLGSFDHRVYAVDRATGAPRWSFKTESHLNGSPVVGPDGHIYAVSRDLNMYVLDSAKGELIEKKEVGPTIGQPAVDSRGDAYVTTLPRVQAWRVGVDKPLWTFESEGMGMLSGPSLSPDEKTVYAPGSHGVLYALGTDDGHQQWAFKAGGFFSPAAVTADTVYVGSYDHKLYALDAKSGETRWACPTGGPVSCTPTLSPEGLAMFTSHDGKVYAVDARTGDLAWSRQMGDRLEVDPQMGPDGTVLIGAPDGQVHVLDRATGASRYTVSLEGGTAESIALSADGKHIFCSTQQGEMLSLVNRPVADIVQDEMDALERRPVGGIEQHPDHVVIDGVSIPRRN